MVFNTGRHSVAAENTVRPSKPISQAPSAIADKASEPLKHKAAPLSTQRLPNRSVIRPRIFPCVSTITIPIKPKNKPTSRACQASPSATQSGNRYTEALTAQVWKQNWQINNGSPGRWSVSLNVTFWVSAPVGSPSAAPTRPSGSKANASAAAIADSTPATKQGKAKSVSLLASTPPITGPNIKPTPNARPIRPIALDR